MVTRIHKGVRPRLFLREHRKAKGLSAEYMASRMSMERESLLRLEREAMTRATPEKQIAYADALGLSDHRQLWRPPGTPDVDAILSGADDELRNTAADIVQRLVAGVGKR